MALLPFTRNNRKQIHSCIVWIGINTILISLYLSIYRQLVLAYRLQYIYHIVGFLVSYTYTVLCFLIKLSRLPTSSFRSFKLASPYPAVQCSQQARGSNLCGVIPNDLIISNLGPSLSWRLPLEICQYLGLMFIYCDRERLCI